MKKASLILLCITFFLACKDQTSQNQIIKKDAATKESIVFSKPDNCSAFFKTIGFTNICLANKALDYKEVLTTNKACQIDIRSSQLNGGQLDILFYYESDPDEMAYFNARTEANKMKIIPGVTHRNIDDLGDVAFITYMQKEDTKKLVVTINNLRICIQSDLIDGKNHCMYSDNQLEKTARSILDKIY